MDKYRLHQKGFTLVELVLSLVVLSILVAGSMALLSQLARNNADPVWRQQALGIARVYAQELVTVAYLDPQTPLSFCPVAEADRASFDNLCDYDGLQQQPQSRMGQSWLHAEHYQISIALTPDASKGDLLGIPLWVRADVEVSYEQQRVVLSLWRTLL